MNKYTFFIISTLFFSVVSSAQPVIDYKGEKINMLDDQDRQVGIWKVYDEKNGYVIVMHFDNGIVIKGPLYYKGSELVAAFKGNNVELYENGKIVNAHFHTEPKALPILIDEAGKVIERKTHGYLYSVLPMYYGGNDELYRFIRNNFNKKLLKAGTGMVKVAFVIDEIGRTSLIKVVESSDPDLNEEAIRVISISPRWQSSLQYGKYVRISYAIPINFN